MGGDHTCHGCMRFVGDLHAAECPRSGRLGRAVTVEDTVHDPFPKRESIEDGRTREGIPRDLR